MFRYLVSCVFLLYIKNILISLQLIKFSISVANLLAYSGAPEGYNFDDFIRDQDIFTKSVYENYPECLVVGPCSVGGGTEWASTYLDVFRTLNELGTFPTITDGVIFHNTLASSDYGWLKHGTFEPRPNYFAVLLWSRLMGTTVYDSEIAIQEGAHVFCHSRKDGKDGCVYLIINNSLTDTTTVELPKEATRYTLCDNGNVRNTSIYLNGKELTLGENDELPKMEGESVAGTIKLAPGTCTFLVM